MRVSYKPPNNKKDIDGLGESDPIITLVINPHLKVHGKTSSAALTLPINSCTFHQYLFRMVIEFLLFQLLLFQ